MRSRQVSPLTSGRRVPHRSRLKNDQAEPRRPPFIYFRDVEEHCEATVGRGARCGEELDARRGHPSVSSVEVVDAQKPTDAPSALVPPPRHAGPVHQRARAAVGLSVRRTNHHPPLRSAVVRQRRRVAPLSVVTWSGAWQSMDVVRCRSRAPPHPARRRQRGAPPSSRARPDPPLRRVERRGWCRSVDRTSSRPSVATLRRGPS